MLQVALVVLVKQAQLVVLVVQVLVEQVELDKQAEQVVLVKQVLLDIQAVLVVRALVVQAV